MVATIKLGGCFASSQNISLHGVLRLVLMHIKTNSRQAISWGGASAAWTSASVSLVSTLQGTLLTLPTIVTVLSTHYLGPSKTYRLQAMHKF